MVRIIASIEDPVVIGEILAHLEQTTLGGEVVRVSGTHAPPDKWVLRGARGFVQTHVTVRPARQGGRPGGLRPDSESRQVGDSRSGEIR